MADTSKTNVAPHDVGEPLPVSVVIPCFNRATLISRALDSIRRQARLPAEIIVVDDASSDGTPEVAENWGRVHQIPIRVIAEEQNRGPAAARNRGIELARNPYVAFLDSDDEYLPDCLETIVTPLEIFDNSVASFADATVVTPTTQEPGGLFRPYADLRQVADRTEYAGRQFFRIRAPVELLLPASIIPTSASCFRREMALKVGGMPSNFRSGEDWLFWLRLAQVGDFYFQDLNVSLHHRHDQNLTHPRSAVFISTEKLRGLAALLDGSIGFKLSENTQSRALILHRSQVQHWRYHASRLGLTEYLKNLKISKPFAHRSVFEHILEDPRSMARAALASLLQITEAAINP